MHELSICRSILDSVLIELDERGQQDAHVTKARIVVGGMHQVIPDFMKTAYSFLIEGTPAEGSILEIKILPVRLKCGECGWEGDVPGPIFRCTACGGCEVEFLHGKELLLESLELETEKAG